MGENQWFECLAKKRNSVINGVYFICHLPAERPSPPLNLNFSDQIKAAVTLTWETPLKNGGSMITGYIIERCEEGTDKWLRCNARLCPDLSYRVRTLSFTP